MCWNTRSVFATVGGSAIALGVMFAAAEAITRPTVPAPAPEIDPATLTEKLEGWAADLRSQTGARP